MKFYTRFDVNPQSSTIDQTGECSKTRESEADSCDINKIMERFNRTGKLPTMQTQPAQYGDSRTVDFQAAQNLIKEAKEQFLALPSKVRKAFGNEPQAFLEAIGDDSDDNIANLKKLGIIVDKKPSLEDVISQIAINTAPAQIADAK